MTEQARNAIRHAYRRDEQAIHRFFKKLGYANNSTVLSYSHGKPGLKSIKRMS